MGQRLAGNKSASSDCNQLLQNWFLNQLSTHEKNESNEKKRKKRGEGLELKKNNNYKIDENDMN